MIEDTSLLGNMVKKENHGFRNPCLFLRNHPKKRMMRILSFFAEMIRPIFLRMRLTDVLKTNPYAKYMKDIITYKREIPEAEISTMLANYTFKGEYQRNLEIPEYLVYLAPLKEIILKLLYVILEPVLVL